MKIYIKNMVCSRCIMAIERELHEINLSPKAVELGVAEFNHPLSQQQIDDIASRIVPLGFELLPDIKSQQVEEIKKILILKLQKGKLEEHFSIKKYVSEELGKEYSYISKLFSQSEKVTLEQYFILLKLEKVKELLSYGEHTLNQIAFNLGYSSVQHLSSQFKKVFGLSVRDFKTQMAIQRKGIDQVGCQ